jgi:glutamate N-acetyltransferase/amino-acid N-acetyltransferase
MPQSLPALLEEGTRETFNRITVDGDTSTNDMVLLLANGRAGNRPLTKNSSEVSGFKTMLLGTMEELAQKILQDGEGVTKVIEIKVQKAKSRQEAETISRSIADSPLVKTSFYGEEVNWGRIIAAAGKTRFPISFEKVDLFINKVPLVRKGIILGSRNEQQAQRELTKKNFTITLTLHQGNQEASILATDLSPDYVKINAGYKT